MIFNNVSTRLLIILILAALNYLLFKNINKTEYKLNQKDLIALNVITVFLGILIFMKFDFSYQFIIYSLLSIILTVIALLDFHYKIILDRLNLAIGILAAVHMVITNSYYSSLMGFLIFGAAFLIVSLISGGGIGGGDIKMISAIGLFFGLAQTYNIVIWTFLYAGMIVIPGMIFKISKNKSIALAPFISLSTVVFIFNWI